jgi:peroxiredoxin
MRLSEKRQGRRLEIRSPMRQTPTTAARIVTGLALLFGIASQPLRSPAAEAICSADAKTANLDFTLKDIHGKPFALSDYKGKVVLLDFWATWCPPCRKEIPGFIELYNSYRSRGLAVIGVSMDESTSDIKRFAKRFKMNYPILVGAGRDDLVPAFGPLPLPTAFVIARDGRICAKHEGLTPKEQFEREIDSLF